KVEILKQRYWAKPADSLVDRAAHEDSRVAVIEPNEPYQSAKSRKPSAEGRITIENDAKIPTDDLWIRRDHIANLVQCSGQQSLEGVQEQQYLARSCLRADTDRRSAASEGNKCLDFVSARNLSGSVLATSIYHDHLVLCSLLLDSIEQTRQ